MPSRRLLVLEASPSGEEVTSPVKVKATGKQPNLLFFETLKIKLQNAKQKVGSAASRHYLLAQNPTAKLCVDGWSVNFSRFFETGRKLANKR